MAFETHYGYDYSKLHILDSNYAVVESINLPLCTLQGNVTSLQSYDIRHDLITNESISVNKGYRGIWTLNWNDFATKDSLAIFLKILKYNSDYYKGRGLKYFYFVPHSDKPYIMFRCNIAIGSFDFKLLEAMDLTDGYELPVITFESCNLIDADEPIIEFPGNPALWIKSTEVCKLFDIADTNTYITRALDSSGNFRHMTGNTPTLINDTLNGYPVMNFDGTSDVLRTSTFTLSQPLSIYIVLAQMTWTSGDYLFDGYTKDTAVMKQRTSTPQAGYSSDGSSFLTNTSDLALTSYKILSVVSDNVASSASNNTSVQVNNNTAIIGSTADSALAGFTIGAGGDVVSAFSNIRVAEAIIFPVKHSSTERTTVRNYLSRKYFNTTY